MSYCFHPLKITGGMKVHKLATEGHHHIKRTCYTIKVDKWTNEWRSEDEIGEKLMRANVQKAFKISFTSSLTCTPPHAATHAAHAPAASGYELHLNSTHCVDLCIRGRKQVRHRGRGDIKSDNQNGKKGNTETCGSFLLFLRVIQKGELLGKLTRITAGQQEHGEEEEGEERWGNV